MNKGRLVAVFTLVVVIVVAVIAGLYFFQRPKEVADISTGPFELNGQFAGAESANISADARSLNRVVRGYIEGLGSSTDSNLFLSVQINWPEETPQQIRSIKLLPQTEFLCWPSTFTTGDGSVAQIKDTIYLLEFDKKLFTPGQKPLSYEEAMGVLSQKIPVIVALQEPYTATAENVAFQVAIVGCQ